VNLMTHFEVMIDDESAAELDVKLLYGAYTMDAVIQVAFGTKVDSLAEPDSPVIRYAQKVFSSDMTVKQCCTVFIVFIWPKLAKILGLQLFKEPVQFFRKLSEDIIRKKKQDLIANPHHLGGELF